MIGIADIEAARMRLGDWVRRTPVMAFGQARTPVTPQARLTLKLECQQVTGSFKARGAMNRALASAPEALARGLVTASGGNHGLAVARTAQVLGLGATVFVPATAAPDKVAKIRGWGADLRVVGQVFDEAAEAALRHGEATGALYLHPFADPLVVAGQGTLGLDILDEVPDADTILVAIGGGGLMAGLGTAVKARRAGVRVIGIEPEGSPTLHAALAAGEVVTLPAVTTRVPTMACRRTDPRVFDLVRAHADAVVLVSDEAMEAAARRLWFEFGVAADLSGAASLAALLSGAYRPAAGEHVVVLVCGAGTDGSGANAGESPIRSA